MRGRQYLDPAADPPHDVRERTEQESTMSMDVWKNPEGAGIYKDHELQAVLLSCGHLCKAVPVRADGKCCDCAGLTEKCEAHPQASN